MPVRSVLRCLKFIFESFSFYQYLYKENKSLQKKRKNEVIDAG